MFVDGFISALGFMAAIAAVGAALSIVVGIPFYFYMKKNLKIWQEMYGVIKRHNERHPHEE